MATALRPKLLAALVAWCLLVGAAALLTGVWLGGDDRVGTAEESPRGEYLLVTRSGDRLQRMRNRGMEVPGYAELYRVYDGTRLCRSGMVDFLDNGRVSWSEVAVQVGMVVEFRPFDPSPAANCREAAEAPRLHGPQIPPRRFVPAALLDSPRE